MGLFSKAQPPDMAVTGTSEAFDKEAAESVDATGNRFNAGKVQSGVARVEAITKVWSRAHLMVAYAM